MESKTRRVALVRFCLVAHYQQAATLMKRNAVIGRMFGEMEKLRKNSDFQIVPKLC